MEFIKLKDNVSFEKLLEYGFFEDTSNCEHGDYYYSSNNYYIQINDFRITVNTLNRNIDILCLPTSKTVHNMYNIKPLFDLIKSDIVEVSC